MYSQSWVKNTYQKLQVNTTIHFYKIPHNKTGNLDRTRVLNFLKSKLRRLQKVNTQYNHARIF